MFVPVSCDLRVSAAASDISSASPVTTPRSGKFQAGRGGLRWLRHQWDMVVHVDETTPSRPLDRGEDAGCDSFSGGDGPPGAPPTFPSGV